jgi:hypothetical protein
MGLGVGSDARLVTRQQGKLRRIDQKDRSEIDLATAPLYSLYFRGDKNVACNQAEIFFVEITHLNKDIATTQTGMDVGDTVFSIE